MEISLPFDSSEQTMDLIKLAALYYEKVSVVCPEDEDGAWYSEQLFESTSVLQEAKVILKKEFNSMACVKEFAKHLATIDDESGWGWEQIEKLFLDEHFQNGFSHCSGIYRSQLEKQLESISLPELISAFDDLDSSEMLFGFQWGHFMIQYAAIHHSLCDRQNCTSSNEYLLDVINQLMQMSGQSSHLKTTPAGIMTTLNAAVPILLPNYSQLSYDDILEMRLKAKDELHQLRYYISILSSKYAPDDKDQTNAKLLIEGEIRQSIGEFESKVHGLRIESIQRMLKSTLAASPVPMLATFFTDIPALASIGASLGIITAVDTLEYIKQKKELKTNPLYFTVKLNKQGKGKR